MATVNSCIGFLKTWYYANIKKTTIGGGSTLTPQIRLYDADREPLLDFNDADSMTEYLLEEASRGKRNSREEIEENFMKNMSILRGEMNDSECGLSRNEV